MKPTHHSESSSPSDLSRFTKTSASSCDSLGISAMSKYTSLREILSVTSPPSLPSPPTPPPESPVKSPSMHGCGSGSEIPIRNPLVKQAALAYLQPMARRPTGTIEEGIFGKFKEVCCGWQCGCLEWLHGAASMDFFSTDHEEDDSDLRLRRRTTGGG